MPSRPSRRSEPAPTAGVAVALARLLVVHCTAEIWVWAAYGKFGSQVGVWAELAGLWPPIDPRPGFLVALVLSAVAILAFVPGRARLAAAVQGALMVAIMGYFFPNVPNHFVAVTIGLGLCAFCDPERESDLLLMGLRSVAALIFFGAGIQKVLSGSYFRGAVLGFMIGQGAFTAAFRYLLPAEEIERLRAAALTGPFYLSSWIGLTVANLTWILEIVLPLGLLVRRLRVPAAIASIGLLVAIQAPARELFFASFMVPLMLLWISPAACVYSIPLVYALDAYLVVAGFGFVPNPASL